MTPKTGQPNVCISIYLYKYMVLPWRLIGMGEGRGGALLGGEVDHCSVTVDYNWREFQNNFCYISSLASTKETYVELSVGLVSFYNILRIFWVRLH